MNQQLYGRGTCECGWATGLTGRNWFGIIQGLRETHDLERSSCSAKVHVEITAGPRSVVIATDILRNFQLQDLLDQAQGIGLHIIVGSKVSATGSIALSNDNSLPAGITGTVTKRFLPTSGINRCTFLVRLDDGEYILIPRNLVELIEQRRKIPCLIG